MIAVALFLPVCCVRRVTEKLVFTLAVFVGWLPAGPTMSLAAGTFLQLHQGLSKRRGGQCYTAQLFV